MTPIPSSQQNFSFQPLWLEVKNKAQHSKKWISDHCVPNLKPLQDKISKTSFQPFYERSIKPLNKIDAFALIGVPLLVITISTVAFYTLGELACALTAFFGAGVIGLAVVIPVNHLHAHYNQEALPHLDNLIKAIENSNLTEVENLLGILESPNFSHLEKEIKKLHQEFNSFKQSRLPDQENRAVFLAYVDAFKKRLGIQAPVPSTTKSPQQLAIPPQPTSPQPVINSPQPVNEILEEEEQPTN